MNERFRQKLINALLLVPASSDHTGRDSLLAGVPNPESLRRNHSLQRTDIELIVDQLTAMRAPNGQPALWVVISNAIEHVKGTDAGIILQDLRRDLQAGCASGDPQDYQLCEPCSFDLNQTVEDFLDALPYERKLVGFTVCCYSTAFLTNLCQRLKYVLGRSNVNIKPLIVVDPAHTTVESILLTVKRYRLPLRRSDVLLAAQVLDEQTAHRFWQSMLAEFGGRLDNRLIVIMVIGSASKAPQDTILLTPPRFRKAHVLEWVSQVVQRLNWPQEFVSYWTSKAIAECTFNGELHIELIYEHLQETLLFLQQYPTLEHFRSVLEERGQI